MKVYVDSNVVISILLDEFGRGFEFMSLRSEEFFNSVFDCKYTIVISDLVIKEIANNTGLSFRNVEGWFSKYSCKIDVLAFTEEDIIFAKKFGSKLLWDFVHASVAIRTGCEAICTWNVKDFEKVSEKMKILTPNQL